MEYNTQQEKLILPEYGRNIQKMVDRIKNVEDREGRNKMALSIITVMGNMYPHLRDIADFKHKLWDHLLIMSDFTLDIDSPYPTPSRESFQDKPKRVPYNNAPIKYRYYGKIIQKLIKRATELADDDEKSALLEIIANHMKKSYLMWNKEVVTDDIIFDTIIELSNGELHIDKDLKLSNSKDLFTKSKKSGEKRKRRQKSQ